MKTTLRTSTGGRLIIEPSPTRANVWITHTHPDMQSVTILVPLYLAAVFAQAVEATATMIEEGQGDFPELPAGALEARAA